MHSVAKNTSYYLYILFIDICSILFTFFVKILDEQNMLKSVKLAKKLMKIKAKNLRDVRRKKSDHYEIL